MAIAAVPTSLQPAPRVGHGWLRGPLEPQVRSRMLVYARYPAEADAVDFGVDRQVGVPAREVAVLGENPPPRRVLQAKPMAGNRVEPGVAIRP